jgi:hypothetical protein
VRHVGGEAKVPLAQSDKFNNALHGNKTAVQLLKQKMDREIR